MRNLLIIGHTYPEPSTTAAGGRMMQLIELLLEEGYKITFATTASPSEKGADLLTLGISSEMIALNDPSFDLFLEQLNPSVVVFDRYITEEQFGWRVAQKCPKAFKILDTEDLHFLRKARQEAFKQEVVVNDTHLFSEMAKREIASILRSDLTLIISEAEMDLLQQTFGISRELLCYLPFLVESPSEETKRSFPSFQERQHFMTVGNLFHAPNVDSVVYLKKEIWPLIKKRLPKAELHIYGAYAPKHISQMHQPKEGFYIKGWVNDISEVMQQARICLAPLRFGAGLKGKFFDAMLFGTPYVTTTIGVEGVVDSYLLAKNSFNTVGAFVDQAVLLYLEEDLWNGAQQNGYHILENRFRKDKFSEVFKIQLRSLIENLTAHRRQNFMGQLLQHQSMQATKYLSKWIEAKNNLS